MTLERLTQITSVGISSGITLHNATLTGVTTLTTLSAGGDINAVNGTFSGNVSVAGTITYEDVSNVDSVGVVTARSGLHVTGGGLDVVGISTLSGGSVSGESAGTVRNILTISETGSQSSTGQRILFKNSEQNWEQGAVTAIRETTSNNFSLALSSSSGGTNLERLRITSAGLVGIGTDNPQNKLQVFLNAPLSVPSAGTSGHHATIGDVGFGVAVGALNSGKSYIQGTRWDGTSTNYDLLLQPNGGSVGIGTDNPTSLLHLSSTTAPQLNVHAPTSGGSDSQLRISSGAGNYRRIIFYDSAATPTKNNFEIAVQEVDNSLFFGPSTAVGGLTFSGSTGLRIDASGRMTIPSQPAWSVFSGNNSYNNTEAEVWDGVVWIGGENHGTIHVNTGNHYTSSNGRFTAPVAGKYWVYFSVTTGDNNNHFVNVHKNGLGIADSIQLSYSQGLLSANWMAVVDLAANDYLQAVRRGTGYRFYNLQWGGYLIG